jgi:hypothetical protein
LLKPLEVGCRRFELRAEILMQSPLAIKRAREDSDDNEHGG